MMITTVLGKLLIVVKNTAATSLKPSINCCSLPCLVVRRKAPNEVLLLGNSSRQSALTWSRCSYTSNFAWIRAWMITAIFLNVEVFVRQGSRRWISTHATCSVVHYNGVTCVDYSCTFRGWILGMIQISWYCGLNRVSNKMQNSVRNIVIVQKRCCPVILQSWLR
jgi:hypothetical protein